MYQHSLFKDSHKEKILILDSGTIESGESSLGTDRVTINNVTGGLCIDYTCHLIENFVIDKPSDIYIDNVIVKNIKGNSDLPFLILDLSDLRIKQSCNNPSLHGNIMIPNEQTSDGGVLVSISKSGNYICDTQPIKLNNFRIRLYNPDGDTTEIFNTMADGDSRVTLELVFREK